MSSKGRKIAKNLGKSLRKKFESDSQNDDLQQRAAELSLSLGSPTLQPGAEMRSSSISASAPGVVGKSTSLSTIGNEPGDPAVVDHSQIIALTHDVKNFSDTLAKLKILFIEGLEPGDESRVLSHESLGEVLAVLKSTLQRYSALQSPEIFTAAKVLISKIKSHNYEEELEEEDLQLFLDAIDQLALSFSRSVSEYLMGDIVTQQQLTPESKVRSCDNLVKAQEEEQAEAKSQAKKTLTPAELDAVMVGLEAGLDLALQRAKAWSRYTRDIISYIEKKSQLELEYAKNLSRISHSMQPILTSEGYLPLQSVFCTALSQDAEFASNLQASHAVLHTSKFVEPLTARRNEHDRVRKSVKETWDREVRRMQDTVSNLRKAQALYISRQQEFERARETVQKSDGEKLEKKKKLEEEAMHKAAEAETTYKACVAEANHRQKALEKTKTDLLGKIREQIQVCDQVIKTVAVDYFSLLHTVWSPVPVQYQTLSESSNSYETGCQYAEFIRRLPASASRPCRTEEFTFEPYVPGQKPGEVRKTSVHSNGSSGEHIHSNEGSPVASPRRDKYRSPVRAWGQTGQPLPQAGSSDTDSASGSTKSHESSPSSSPHNALRRQIVSSQSLDELTEEDMERVTPAQEKRSQMKRTMTVHGEDSLELPGILNQRGRRNTMFGVDFQEQVERYKSQVPPIITKCLAEIERRGVMIKGIYRVSGVKSKVESLCQRFDINPELVDLEEVHPNIISNVLKLYLRQLPEPLLTFRLYSDFIHLAKENMAGYLVGDKVVERLSALVSKLPPSNFRTCAVLMHHLHRVAAHSDLNQMSSSNLGIVFGPTLLRPLEGTASLASLVDTPHQTRAIELLITHAEAVFGPGDDYQLVPDQTPVEALEDSAENLAIMVPCSSSEPSPEKSPTKELGEPVAAAAASPATSAASSSVTSAAAPPKSAQQEEKIPVVSDAASASPRLEPSSADFSLPGSASHDKYDSVFVDNASTPLADESRSTVNDTKGTKDVPSALTPKTRLAETAPAPDTTLTAPQPVATLVDSSTWPGPASRSAASIPPGPTIPASPTITTRSGSSGSTGSAVSDGRLSPTKGDPRSDRFKLEQRKLLSAIKSDPKVGIAVVGEGSSTPREDADRRHSDKGEEGEAVKGPAEKQSEVQSIPGQESPAKTVETKVEKPGDVKQSASEADVKPGDMRAGIPKTDSKVKKVEPASKTPASGESLARVAKLGTTAAAAVARSASGPTTARPAGSAARVRTTTASAVQRRANITGISSGGVASTTAPTTTRSSLTRYTPASGSAMSASHDATASAPRDRRLADISSANRRSLGAQPSTSPTHLRVSSSSPGTSPQRSPSSSTSNSPSRHSFESSLRSYSSNASSSSLSTSEAAGNAARTRRISGERSHGSVRDMTPGTQTKTGLTSSPTSGHARTLAAAKAAAVAGSRVASGGASTTTKRSGSPSVGTAGLTTTTTLSTTSKTPACSATGVSGISPVGSSIPSKISSVPSGPSSSSVSSTSPTKTANTSAANTLLSLATVDVPKSELSPAAASSSSVSPSTSTVPKSTAASGVGSSVSEVSKSDDKCQDAKAGETDSHPQQSVVRDLSQDRTPRFV